MGLNLVDLANNTATVTPTYRGEECEVKYRPEALTFDMIESLMGSDPAAQGDAFYIAIAGDPDDESKLGIIAEWDILSDGRLGTKKGKKLPVRPDTARSLPLKLIMAIVMECVEDSMPGEARPPSSVG